MNVSLESGSLILLVIVQGFLALIIGLIMLGRRIRLLNAGTVRLADVAVSKEPWSEHAKKASNAYDNQFQVPLLFMVAVAIAIYLKANWFDVWLAVGFVTTRFAHAAVHITINHVTTRLGLFLSGAALLMVWWAVLVWRTLSAMGVI